MSLKAMSKFTKTERTELLKHFHDTYNIPMDQLKKDTALCLITGSTSKSKPTKSKPVKKEKKSPKSRLPASLDTVDDTKFMCRVWRSGNGGQCSRDKIPDTLFCKQHSDREKYDWTGLMGKPRPTHREGEKEPLKWKDLNKYDTISMTQFAIGASGSAVPVSETKKKVKKPEVKEPEAGSIAAHMMESAKRAFNPKTDSLSPVSPLSEDTSEYPETDVVESPISEEPSGGVEEEEEDKTDVVESPTSEEPSGDTTEEEDEPSGDTTEEEEGEDSVDEPAPEEKKDFSDFNLDSDGDSESDNSESDEE